MKTFKLLATAMLSFIILSFNSFGQTNTFPSSGNVGIGLTNPGSILQIKSNSSSWGMLRLDRPDAGEISIGFGVNSNYVTPWAIGVGSWNTSNNFIIGGGGGSVRFIIENGTGNIGIGTTLPSQRLEIAGDATFPNAGIRLKSNASGTSALSYIEFGQTEGGNWSSTGYFGDGFSGQRQLGIATDIGYDFGIGVNGNHPYYTPNLFIKASNGFIGVGTNSPMYALDVSGTVHAKEIKIDLQNGSDFVFKNGYNLMNISDLEKYITENQHLPDIASENEMISNGVEMKDMQMKLLQKVEELTLYIIDQDKKYKEQQRTISQQNERINRLEELIENK